MKSKKSSGKQNLLASDGSGSEDEDSVSEGTPIWLLLTTKRHITDTKRLKPGKM